MKKDLMKTELFSILAVIALSCSSVFCNTPITPFSVNGGIRCVNRNGSVEFLNNSPPSQCSAIVKLQLDKEYKPGTWYVYFKLNSVKTAEPMEISLGEDLRAFLPRDTGSGFLGPVRFDAAKPFSAMEARVSVNLTLDAVILAEQPDPGIAAISPEMPKNAAVFWIRSVDPDKYPCWFRTGEEPAFRYESVGKGNAAVGVEIYDYNHDVVAKKTETIALGSSGKIVLPELKKFGPYLAVFQITCPNGEKIEQQKIFALLSAAPEKLTDRLGGHGNSALLEAMGAGRERLWDTNRSLLWRMVEKEKGKYDWSKSKLPPQSLKPIVVVETVPDWAKKPEEDPAGFLEYVDRLTKRYKGQVEIYEIFNEPYHPGPNHAEIVGKVAEVIRRNDPEVKIATGGPPEEIPPALEWWETQAKAGLFNHVNTITAHLYVGAGGTHPLDQDIRFDAYATALKQLLKRFGQENKELIDSESGLCPNETFYLGEPPVYGLWGGKGFSKRTPVPYKIGTPMYARLLLLHLNHGIPWMIYHTSNSYGNSWSLCDGDVTPLPGAVAIAQAVKLLENAEPAGKPALPKGLFGASFQKGGETIAVFWAVHLKMGETRFVSSAAADNIRLLDLFCNPLPSGKEVQLGSDPVYIVGKPEQVNAFFAGLKVRSEFEKDSSVAGRFDQLVTRTGYQGFRIKAPKGAKGCGLSVIHDEETVSAGKPEDSWQAAAEKTGDPVTIVYEWDKPQAINWITAGWAVGRRPEKYKVEWFDGTRWIPVQGTWQGWRKPNENVESYPVQEFKTRQLRFSYLPNPNVSTCVAEFSALCAPRITPPVTEMQEIYNSDFTPDKDGWINDWLICGPFPATGNRYTRQEPAFWNHNFLAPHYHYGRPYDDSTIKPQVDQRHFVTFTENPQTKWKTGKATVNWFPYHGKNGLIDFAAAFRQSNVFEEHRTVENCYGYAICYLTLKNDFKGVLAVGSDDGYKIMIDKKLVAQKVVYRGAVPDQEKYPVELTAGEHRIMVRIHNDINDHGFFLRFLNPDGTSFTGYTVKIVP